MENYILIQRNKSIAPLLAFDGRVYNIKFGRCGMNLCVYDESWICTCVFNESKTYIISNFLKEFNPDVTSQDINNFICQFKIDHPLTKIKKYSYDQIPLIATESNDCMLRSGIFSGSIYLSLQEEQELMGIVCGQALHNYKALVRWFDNYCDKYAIHAKLKRDQKFESEELAMTFCLIHGLSEDMLDKSYVPFYKNALGSIVLIGAILLWLSVVGWLLESNGWGIFVAFFVFIIPLGILMEMLKQ